MTRDDLELYITGNFDGDIEALERELAGDPALAEEARFELLLREAAAAATFCPGCGDLVRSKPDERGATAGEDRCDACGVAVRPGGYTVERVLVSNAHGRMYVARDADGKQVALKELAFVQAPSLDALGAFEREARFLRALAHPAIPRFVASFEEGSGVHVRYYLAQELVEGEPLDAHLDEHWYTEAEVVAVARSVLEVLVYLQDLTPMVIHRDIKPANLLKRADGSIAVVDFGAAYVHGTTAGSTTIGTFGYMPVEQLAGLVDATTDPYALGATLIHLLTRQEPWRVLQVARSTVLNVSAPTRAFLDKLVAADPKDRFANAKAALAALDHPETMAPATAKPRRRPWRYVALVAGVIAAGTGAGVMASRHRHANPAGEAVAEAVARLAYFEHEMCACEDEACSRRVTDDMIADRLGPTYPQVDALAEQLVRSSQHYRRLGACMAMKRVEVRPEIAVFGAVPQSCLDYEAAIGQIADCEALPREAQAQMRASFDAVRASWRDLDSMSTEARRAMAEACRAAEVGIRDAYAVCQAHDHPRAEPVVKKAACQDRGKVDPFDPRPVCGSPVSGSHVKVLSGRTARVTIDGLIVGDTPVDVRVAAGRHVVVVTVPETGKVVRNEVVTIGEDAETITVHVP